MREFRFTGKKSQPLIWKISQEGEWYKTVHGQLNGAMQEFSDRPGEKGKSDTKAYVSSIDNATFHVNREIRKKLEHGYIEYINGKPTEEQVTTLDFNNFLPKNFCGPKPQTSIEHKALEKLHKAGKARYTRKYDGFGMIAYKNNFSWEFYSRRMDIMTDRFPKHIEELEKTNYLPGTILTGEVICMGNKPGKEDFKAASSFCRSLPEESRKLVEDGKVQEPKFVIFDILFYNGKDLKNTSYDERMKYLEPHFYEMIQAKDKLVVTVDHYNVTPNTWQDVAKCHGWEGFVVTDGTASPGDKFYSFDGDAKRPKCSWKLKPVREDDVVIFAATTGSGKRLGGVGAVHVKQRHPSTKEWFYCGKVGSGFTEEDLEVLERLCIKNDIPILEKDKDVEKLDLNDINGLVAMIEYSERQPGTNKFRFPVFCRLRTDKLVKECFAQNLNDDE